VRSIALDPYHQVSPCIAEESPMRPGTPDGHETEVSNF